MTEKVAAVREDVDLHGRYDIRSSVGIAQALVGTPSLARFGSGRSALHSRWIHHPQ
ncbi:MAG: hypothetical protein R6V13_12760 [Anaerolineae bacterium]